MMIDDFSLLSPQLLPCLNYRVEMASTCGGMMNERTERGCCVSFRTLKREFTFVLYGLATLATAFFSSQSFTRFKAHRILRHSEAENAEIILPMVRQKNGHSSVMMKRVCLLTDFDSIKISHKHTHTHTHTHNHTSKYHFV
jgi:hypothetical protein